MAWIETHQSLRDHPKLLQLSRELRIGRAQALGHLQLLWLWALDYAPDGDISALDPAAVSAACDWQGDPAALMQALLRPAPPMLSAWVDADGKIHDWEDYAGRIVASKVWKRKRDREYQERRRQRLADDSLTNRQATVPNLPNQPTTHTPSAREPISDSTTTAPPPIAPPPMAEVIGDDLCLLAGSVLPAGWEPAVRQWANDYQRPWIKAVLVKISGKTPRPQSPISFGEAILASWAAQGGPPIPESTGTSPRKSEGTRIASKRVVSCAKCGMSQYGEVSRPCPNCDGVLELIDNATAGRARV